MERRTRRTWRLGAPHNMIAHPLMVVCPPAGEWVHRHTRETVPTRYGRKVKQAPPLNTLEWLVGLRGGWPERFHLFRRNR